DVGGAELPAEVRVLLVGQGLERRRVGEAAAAPQRRVDGELRDERLPGPRRGRDDHRLALEDRLDRLILECLEGERVAGGEGFEQPGGGNEALLHSSTLRQIPSALGTDQRSR